MRNGIERKFARPASYRTNGKAKRLLQRSMEMWIKKHSDSPEHRGRSPARFVKGDNWGRLHKSSGSFDSLKNRSLFLSGFCKRL